MIVANVWMGCCDHTSPSIIILCNLLLFCWILMWFLQVNNKLETSLTQLKLIVTQLVMKLKSR